MSEQINDTSVPNGKALTDEERIETIRLAKNAIEDRLEQYLDIIGLNEYCGWYTPDFKMLPELFANSAPEKPVIITEFGADAYMISAVREGPPSFSAITTPRAFCPLIKNTGKWHFMYCRVFTAHL